MLNYSSILFLNECDHQSLQEGVSELHVWTKRWLLTLNKC